MIIKSHIRGGFRQAAAYLKDQGENEKARTVEISDPDARNLDEAFQNMWKVASGSKAKKPLHHISINPYKDERLTDEQVLRIVERCEQVYGYKPGEHQRVIVEHIKDGRQHFHVMWNRVSLETGKAVWPGLHWKKSRQVAREMETELGLRRPIAKRTKRARVGARARLPKTHGRYRPIRTPGLRIAAPRTFYGNTASLFRPAMLIMTSRHRKKPHVSKLALKRPNRMDIERTRHLAWAWANGRLDVLARYGITLPEGFFEP